MGSLLIALILAQSITKFLPTHSASSEVALTVKGKLVRVTLNKTEYANGTLLLTLVQKGKSSDKLSVEVTACLFSAHGKENTKDCKSGNLEAWWLDDESRRSSLPLAGDFDGVGCHAIIGRVALRADGASNASSGSVDFELLNPTFRMQ